MKPLCIAAWIIGFSALIPVSSGQAACPVKVRASIELASEEFSLADILASDSCPELRRAAAAVRLGSAPLAGSVRVLPGDGVRVLLEKALEATENGGSRSVAMIVPERITVRRAGARGSCVDIGARILASTGSRGDKSSGSIGSEADLGGSSSRAIDCGAADRIRQSASLELFRTVWDPVLGTWDLFTRCVHPGDCVPFLVRLPGYLLRPAIAPSDSPGEGTTDSPAISSASGSDRTARNASGARPLVRPGETISLLWDQDGIRLVVSAVCLDPGRSGDAVRARIARGGRIVRAIVMSAGKLRAAS